MLIDTHFHCFTRSLPLAQGARYQPSYDAEFSALQALWQAHDVERGVIVQPSFLGTDNSYLLQLCEHFPQILRGVVVISSDISHVTLAQMHRNGVRGIRFNWVGIAQWPDVTGSAWVEVRESLQALGMHVQLHVEGARLAQAAACFTDWKVPLVIDHLGRPDSATSPLAHGELVQQLAKQRASDAPLFLKISATYRCGGVFNTVAHSLLKTLGAEHFFWGSDWPFTQHETAQNYAAQISTLYHLAPDEQVKRAIMQNASSLYF